jgi:hypothetical protein
MTSIFPIAYGFSKFVSGVLGARSSPQLLLAGGLMATAVMNVSFGFGSTMGWFLFFWGLNGILQANLSEHCPPREQLPHRTPIVDGFGIDRFAPPPCRIPCVDPAAWCVDGQTPCPGAGALPVA